MTTYAVVGGSGTIGRPITTRLRAGGHEVRILGRSSPEHPVDLRSGAGLGAALDGVDVVIDGSNGDPRRPEPVLVDGARRLLAAAAEAGVSHLVAISVVGSEDVPARYYRAKLAQEAIVREGRVPWTIVRSTQFHELVAAMLATLGRWRLTPRSSMPLQPIAAGEAAAVVAGVAVGGPRLATVLVGGPEAESLSALALAWGRDGGASSARRLAVPVPLPPALGRPLRAGALTCADPDHRGALSFAGWLRTTR